MKITMKMIHKTLSIVAVVWVFSHTPHLVS